MKLLFVHDHIFLSKEGKVYSNTFSYEILKRYVDVFSEVTIVARHCEIQDTEELLLSNGEGVNFVFLESVASLGSYFGLRQRHENTLGRLIKAHDGLIVKLPSEFGLMAANIARKEKLRYMSEVVGCAWDAMWNYGSLSSKLYAPYFFYKMKHCVEKASAVSYVTERFLQKRYPASKTAKTIGISDVSLAEVHDEVLEKRMTKIEALDEKITFATMANLDLNYKGIDIALRTLADVSKDYKAFSYHIAGAGDPGKYKSLAKELDIEDKVFFEGTLSGRDAVFEWLDSIDIYLQPSLQEGLPRALVEAMSRGCPAVGSSVGGIPELLEINMVFSHRVTGSFQKIILSLMHDKALKFHTAKYNFEKAKKYNSSSLDRKRKEFLKKFSDTL